MTVQPITKEEAQKQAVETIPDFVYTAFNGLIVLATRKGNGIVTQNEVLHEINVLTDYAYQSHEIINNGWLNVEEYYRKAGWTVSYDAPSIGETYKAYFTFE